MARETDLRTYPRQDCPTWPDWSRRDAAGLPVDLDVGATRTASRAGSGSPRYRIVQEALTNAVRHAGPAGRVRGRVRARGLLVEVTDDGRGPTAARDRGHGLVGMRERVAVMAARLETGAGPTAGTAYAPGFPYGREPMR